MQNNNNKKRDLNDLTRSVLYEEIPNQNLMRLTILVIGGAFLLFIGWSSITGSGWLLPLPLPPALN